MKKFLMIPVALLASSAFAAPKISAQSIIVNPVAPALSVNVHVDRDLSGNATAAYKAGDPITISTTVNRDAYVYLFNVDAKGNVDQILPNRLQNDGGNFVKANTTALFPSSNSGFTFSVGDDTGLNKVLALASLTPLDMSQLSTFKNGQDQFATVAAKGQDGLAQALSIVVTPVAQNSWVTDTAFYNVVSATPINTGSLFVGTNVAGSTVILSGRTLGGANVTYSGFAPGTYPVRVKAPGYADYTTTVPVSANTTTNLNVTFNTTTTTQPAPVQPAPVRPAPVTNTGNYALSISSRLNGARIFVDGVEAGTIQNGGLNLNVSRGTHEVVMVAPGYRTFVSTYDVINSGKTITINPAR